METTEIDNGEKYEFDWWNLVNVIFAQACMSLTSLIMVAYAFKVALLAEINQGCITSLFSITAIYVAILFYFKFGEKISLSKILGIILMIPCITLLSIDNKEAKESDHDLTASQMQVYGLLAILCGMLPPFCWTLRTYYARLAFSRSNFPAKDLAIDQMFF